MERELCLTCRSLSGVQRISPGPTIFEGQYWVVEHAYPVALKGWLVIVLKRHCTALHELTSEEYQELGTLQQKTVRVIHEESGSAKEYLMCFAEGPGFRHIHVHVVARAEDIPAECKGAKVFTYLKPEVMKPVAEGEVRAFCEALKGKWG